MLPYLAYNGLIDLFLLWGTAVLAGLPIERRRLAVGAAVGLLAALVPSPVFRWLAPPAMLLLTFRPSRGAWGRLLASFLVLAFLVAGLSFGLLGLTGLSGRPWGPAATLVALPLAALLIRRYLGRQVTAWFRHEVLLRVQVGDRQAKTLAFVDTGNQLRDPWSRWPVVVAEHRILQSLWPPEVARIFASELLNSVPDFTAYPEWSARFRLIPFRSLGNSGGFLLGFRPDGVWLGEGDGEIARREVIIGVSREPLSPTGGYGALMPAGLWPQAS